MAACLDRIPAFAGIRGKGNSRVEVICSPGIARSRVRHGMTGSHIPVIPSFRHSREGGNPSIRLLRLLLSDAILGVTQRAGTIFPPSCVAENNDTTRLYHNPRHTTPRSFCLVRRENSHGRGGNERSTAPSNRS